MIVHKQKWVPTPEMGGVYLMSSGYRLIPVVLVGFNKVGGWQIVELENYYSNGRIRKRGLMADHSERLVKIDLSLLSANEQYKYNLLMTNIKK